MSDDYNSIVEQDGSRRRRTEDGNRGRERGTENEEREGRRRYATQGEHYGFVGFL